MQSFEQLNGTTSERSNSQHRDWAYALLLSGSLVGFSFVSLVPTLLGIESRPTSIVFRAVMLAGSLWVVARWLGGITRFRSGPIIWVFFSFWGLLLARLVWDETFSALPLPLDWIDYWLFGVGVALIPAVALLEVPTSATLRLALTLTEVMGVASVVGLVWLGAAAMANVGLTGDDRDLDRLATTAVNPAYLGYMAVTVFTVSIFRIIEAARTPGASRGLILLRAAAVLISVGAMVASASKGPIAVAAIISLAFLFVHGKRKRSTSAAFLRLLMLVVVATAGVCAAVVLEESTSLRPVSRFTEFVYDPSTLERRQMLEGAFNQFSGSPILGDNIVELNSLTYPHNVLLESLMSTGVFGGALLTVLMVYSLRRAWALISFGDGREWLGLVHIVFSLLAMTAGSLIFTPHIWATTSAVLATTSRFRQGVEPLPA